MSPIVSVQTSIVPILMLLAIFANSHSSVVNRRLRYFSHCVSLVVAVLVLDLLAWTLDGAGFAGAVPLLYAINSLEFLFGVLIAFVWLCYVYNVLVGEKPRASTAGILGAIPMAIFYVFVFTNLGSGLLFSIDSTGTYVRGPLFIFYILVTFGYIIVSAVMSLIYAAKSPTKSRRHECLVLASFVVLPLIGAIAQVFGYGLNVVWPLTSVSVLIVYLGQINQNVSLDALTGLNNRGQLDKLLLARCGETDRNNPLYLVLIDVDGFKGINDTHGHVVGDKALEFVAATLKRAFGATDAFLARYGGDEFAVVIETSSELDLREDLKDFKCSLESSSLESLGFLLTASFGIAQYSVDCSQGVEWFISSADAKMYEQKHSRASR